MLSAIHLCLSYGKYHEPWTTRFLFPIHKGNDASDLNNYRGITITRPSDHMFILKTIINKYCNTKEGRMFACFVDFQKAFDTVILPGIKLKLLNIVREYGKRSL